MQIFFSLFETFLLLSPIPQYFKGFGLAQGQIPMLGYIFPILKMIIAGSVKRNFA